MSSAVRPPEFETVVSDGGRPACPAPFPTGYRASGVLLHITSLPSPYGIGDLGPAAYSWIDRLSAAGQTWWQCLPLGPTGYCNSPYQCLSSFVGNGLLISPELLIDDGLLAESDCVRGLPADAVDYDAVIRFKHGLLPVVWRRFRSGARKDLWPAFEEFCHARADWLEDYALFRAIKQKFHGASYLDWPPELVERSPSALARERAELADVIDQVRLAQFLLSRQASCLKRYARAKGVRLIGDLPFFVAPDSSDVWAHPQLFLLDERRRPQFVGGVPPDLFSATGQLWGNPVHDWEALGADGYSWPIERLRALLAHVDVIRLDHFRAFAAAWHVPAGAPTAQIGEWVPGPGAAFFEAVRKRLGGLPFIAEDLGLITAEVLDLRDRFKLPGTRVLQFAFDGGADNPHLPANHSHNSVVYTGTHDNPTTREWYETLSDDERRRIWQPACESRDVAREMIRLAWQSPAAVAIAPLQDLLNLGPEGRMNVPGRAEGNWAWRARRHMLSGAAIEWLGDLTACSSRSSTPEVGG